MAPAAADSGGLHQAARSGNAELVRFLLERRHHDPNCLDNTGLPPLFAACQSEPASVEVVWLLLRAGADPSITDDYGTIPLHLMVFRGHVDLVDMLYSAAPATLNHTAANGQTPLYVACCQGDETMVAKLIALGATENTPKPFFRPCPLAEAVVYGFVGVVRILTSAVGLRSVGGASALIKALHNAVVHNKAVILRLLLAVGGCNWRARWANTSFQGRTLLYLAAGYCCPEAVNILLEAGGHEGVEDPDGLSPRDVVGLGVVHRHPWAEAAIHRMLIQGAAYRARSWAWPLDERASVDCADGGRVATSPTVVAAASAVADADLLLWFAAAAVRTAPSTTVPVFLPKENSTLSKRLATIVSR